MRELTKTFAILLVVSLAFAVLVFHSTNRPSQLSATELSFVGTWQMTSSEQRIEFKSDRSLYDCEFSGSWRIAHGRMFMKTWRDMPRTFANEIANWISKPVVNAWDSMNSDQFSFELLIVDEDNVQIRLGADNWQTLTRAEFRPEL